LELWEGAVLIVGGVWLVGYMSRRNGVGLNTVGAPSTTVNSSGTSNPSNLTTITNQAGGDPTTWGEPLLPAQPQPLTGKICPAWGCGGPGSVASTPAVRGIPARPVGIQSGILGGTVTPYRAPVRGTMARPMDVHLL
jgi:hypothetical protein